VVAVSLVVVGPVYNKCIYINFGIVILLCLLKMYVFVRVNTAFRTLYNLSLSTACFGRFDHYQVDLTTTYFVYVVRCTCWCPKNARNLQWMTTECVVFYKLCSFLIIYNRTDHDQRHCYHHVPTVNQRRLMQFISSWWWARGCPKHVEMYLNDEQ
jgi:hypothetical protein